MKTDKKQDFPQIAEYAAILQVLLGEVKSLRSKYKWLKDEISQMEIYKEYGDNIGALRLDYEALLRGKFEIEEEPKYKTNQRVRLKSKTTVKGMKVDGFIGGTIEGVPSVEYRYTAFGFCIFVYPVKIDGTKGVAMIGEDEIMIA